MSERPAESSAPRPAEVVTPNLLRQWPLPAPGDSKDARGGVLVVGGSVGTPGAVLLSGIAALRAGAGRLQLAVAEPAAVAVSVAVPEARVVGIDADGLDPGLVGKAHVVCVGPGVGDPDSAATLLAQCLPHVGERAHVVLDALALVALGTDPSLGGPVEGRLVVTPNAGEAAALLGGDPPQGPDEQAEAAREIARRYRCVASVRQHTAGQDGRTWSDGSGAAGLGTSGSGDVLAGLVAGLLARGASGEQAAVWGTHLHATAGERLASRIGPLGYLARELLDEAPVVLAELCG